MKQLKQYLRKCRACWYERQYTQENKLQYCSKQFLKPDQDGWLSPALMILIQDHAAYMILIKKAYGFMSVYEKINMKRGINMENNAVFSKYKLLAIDIYEWCKKHDLWGDNIIYFDGKAWSNSETWAGVKGKKIAEDLYEYENKNPKDYFEYANPKTLSMSFEGALNHVLNAYTRGWVKLEEQFSKLFAKYNLYYEMGYAWSLSAYEI